MTVVVSEGDANTFKPTRKRDKKETIISDVLVEIIFVIGKINYFSRITPSVQKCGFMITFQSNYNCDCITF